MTCHCNQQGAITDSEQVEFMAINGVAQGVECDQGICLHFRNQVHMLLIVVRSEVCHKHGTLQDEGMKVREWGNNKLSGIHSCLEYIGPDCDRHDIQQAVKRSVQVDPHMCNKQGGCLERLTMCNKQGG